jgi:hypothetical protein
MNRRGFFGRLAAVVVAARLPTLSLKKEDVPVLSTGGWIRHARTFWGRGTIVPIGQLKARLNVDMTDFHAAIDEAEARLVETLHPGYCVRPKFTPPLENMMSLDGENWIPVRAGQHVALKQDDRSGEVSLIIDGAEVARSILPQLAKAVRLQGVVK